MTPVDANQRVWDAQITTYKSMTPPLRPHHSELEIYRELASKAAGHHDDGLDILLLGLTPEIVAVPWPDHARLVVVDRSESMIREFWSGDEPGRRELVFGDWMAMPFESHSFDLVIGDGVFNLNRYPDGFKNLATAVSRLVRRDGVFCVRIFNQASPTESPESVISEALVTGQIDYFGFRLRLASSLQPSAEQGFCVTTRSLDKACVSHGMSLEQLFAKSGYRRPAEGLNQVPDDPDYRVTYPTNEEFVSALSGIFNVERVVHGDHPMSQRTPIFIMQAQNS